jgi:hypothetical protein
MPTYIQHTDMPYMRTSNFNSTITSNNSSKCSTTAANLLFDPTLNQETETLKWFFSAVSAVDHSYKATTENLNKLVSFYL